MKLYKLLFNVSAITLLLFVTAFAEETILLNESLSWQTSAEQVGSGRFVDNGWQTTGGMLIYDAGKEIENGYFQIRMKGWTSPAQGASKNHPLSGWQYDDSFERTDQGGAYWNWRIGEGYTPFKILAKPKGGERLEERIYLPQINGEAHVYRVQWNDGHVQFFFDGALVKEWYFDNFSQRYFTLGRDDNYNYDPPDVPPIMYDIKIGEGSQSVSFEKGVLHDPLDGWSVGDQVGTGTFVDGGGWKSTGGWIEYDAGELISNGYFEAEMRGWTAPPAGSTKNHPLSGWQYNSLYYWRNHEGAYWNWRIGSDNSPNVFAFIANSEGGTRLDTKVGEESWVNDGETHLYRVAWNAGKVKFYFDGSLINEWEFPDFKMQYFLIGKDDGWEYDPPETPPIISNVRIVKVEDLDAATIVTDDLPDGLYQNLYQQTVEAEGGLDPYYWSITSGALPDGLTLNASTGIISGVPTTVGEYDFDITLEDSNDPSVSDVASFSIQIINHAPTFPASDVTVQLLDVEAWAYGLGANDPDGNTIGYTLLQSLDWLALDSDTLRGTTPPGNHQYSLDVAASDGLSSDTLHLTIVVTSDNAAPVFTSSETAQATEDQLFSYTVTATDPEGGSVVLAYTQVPSWLTVSGTTISGTPTEGVSDTVFTVQASDELQTSTLTVLLRVNPVNDAPTIVSAATAQVYTDSTFLYTALATDPEDSSITFTFSNLADWMTVTGPTVTGIAPDEVATFTFQTIASDGALSDTLSITLSVVRPQLPLIIVSAKADTATEDIPYVYAAHAQDPNGHVVSYQYLKYPDWLTVQDSVIYGTPQNGIQDSCFIWIAIAGDLCDTTTVALKVNAVNDAPQIVKLSDITFLNTEQVAIGLDTCAVDIDNEVSTLVWEVTPGLDNIKTVVTNQTLILIAPAWTGESDLEFIVTDPDGASDTLTVHVVVQPESGVADHATIPEVYSLEQNYPNPFNPETQISFGLPKRSEVEILVFNLSGQKVATVFSGSQDAGYHQVRWDASHVPSGTYVIQMKAGKMLFHKKCLLLK